MRTSLTRREREVYDFIVRFTRRERRSPSVTEIATAVPGRTRSGRGSLSTVSELLDSLEQKGFITHGRFGPYGYLIAPADADPTGYTYVVGKVHASGAVAPVEPVGFTFGLDTPSEHDIFFLQVGEPIPALSVLEGDLLIMEHGRSLAPDDLVLLAGGARRPDPVYHLVRYRGIASDPSDDSWKLATTDPEVFRDQIRSPERLVRLKAEEGIEAGYIVHGVTEDAEVSQRYREFLRVARARPDEVRIVAVQIGLLRLTSHWQRNVRTAPL
jgi:repressor LexA